MAPATNGPSAMTTPFDTLTNGEPSAMTTRLAASTITPSMTKKRLAASMNGPYGPGVPVTNGRITLMNYSCTPFLSSFDVCPSLRQLLTPVGSTVTPSVTITTTTPFLTMNYDGICCLNGWYDDDDDTLCNLLKEWSDYRLQLRHLLPWHDLLPL